MGEIRFYAELNDLLPPSRRGRAFHHAIDRPTTVRDVIERFGVPHTEVDLVLVNGTSVDLDQRVKPDDRVSVYPMFEAFDISSIARIRPQPLRQPRFLLDVHLGRLAAYLRLAGFDAAYSNDMSDTQLVERARGEQRILLTRDRGLLKHRAVTHGHLVRATRVREQLTEVIRRFDLVRLIRPFTRCARCNECLMDESPDTAIRRAPPRVGASYREFRRCPACSRLYWKGTHYLRLAEYFDRLAPGWRARRIANRTPDAQAGGEARSSEPDS